MSIWTVRDVVRVTGADAISFLQSLLTNNIAASEQGVLIYAALLTPQGKWQHDMMVRRTEQGVALYVRPEETTSLMQKLMLYKLRSDVTLQVDAAIVAVLGDTGLADPRVAALGAWAEVQKSELGNLPELNAYTEYRVACGVPESGVDMVENTLAMEAGLEALHGVDFAKGCYVGQEVTTRSKFRGNVRKVLSVIRFTDGVVDAGQEIRNGKDVAVGDIRTVGNGQAIAMLRIDAQESPLTAGGVAVAFEAVVGQS